MKLFFAAAAVGALVPGFAIAADPIEGTWKLNVQRSQYRTMPPPKEFTIAIRNKGEDGFEHTVNGTMADGRKVSVTYTATRDGKESPITGDPRYTTVRVRQIDKYTEQTRFFKDGKEVRVDENVLSPDGQTRTLTAQAPGATAANTAVYEKQRE
jgi:hypothetical protein